MLWVDKYRPRSLDETDYHTELSERLLELANDGDLPHLLFYGPSGAGKRTRIAGLLKALFGPGVEKQKMEHREMQTPTKKTVEITTMASSYHIEMNPGDAGNNDRFVVQEIIKEIAQSGALHAKQQRIPYKVVVLVEVDRLTKQAQAALRRTMEKCTSSCRLILCCENPSKVIDPVRSRCLGIRVPAPTEEQVISVLHAVAEKERVVLPDKLASRIAKASKRNVRRAVLAFEGCKVRTTELTDETPIQVPDWEKYIYDIATSITADQSPQKLLNVRDRLFDLLSKCIPADVILKTLTTALIQNLDDTLKPDVLHYAAIYEHRIHLGSKEIFHLEAFVAQYMALYKKYLVTLFD